jgi:hypothetical protein
MRKQGMFLLDVFNCNLTMAVRSMIHAMNTDLVVIPGAMTPLLYVPANMPFKDHSKLHSKWLLVEGHVLASPGQ